jgi:tyrosyl-tRNA synthetase
MSIIQELQCRSLIDNYTEGTLDLLSRDQVTLYTGFDPTSDSLQIGNLIPLLGLARFQRFGHSPIALAGGGTGLIGDPSGKQSERQMLSREIIESNVASIKTQLDRFLDFSTKNNPAIVLNNADWLSDLTLLDFLRSTGKSFSVKSMISKESIKSRMGDEKGISYAEFSYMLLQAYDFLYLFQNRMCFLQAGGSDQWGNITAGVDLIHKQLGKRAYGLTYPLVTNADGRKFGKSETETIWLSAERTSPYAFYQFWLSQDDKDVIEHLKYFTFLSKTEIRELDNDLRKNPEKRDAQQALALEMTRLVHGETETEKAKRASELLFGGSVEGISASEIREICKDIPSTILPGRFLESQGALSIDVFIQAELVRGRGEARRLIASGGLYVNNVRISYADHRISLKDAIEGKFVILRKGKKTYHLIEVQ